MYWGYQQNLHQQEQLEIKEEPVEDPDIVWWLHWSMNYQTYLQHGGREGYTSHPPCLQRNCKHDVTAFFSHQDNWTLARSVRCKYYKVFWNTHKTLLYFFLVTSNNTIMDIFCAEDSPNSISSYSQLDYYSSILLFTVFRFLVLILLWQIL